MPYLNRTPFKGKLRGRDHEIEITFSLSVNDEGEIEIEIEPFAHCGQVFEIYRDGQPGDRVEFVKLDGVSDDGWSVSSEHFVITRFGFGSELNIQGHCALAELHRKLPQPVARSRRVWFVRQLRAVHALVWSGDIGEVIAGGPHDLPAASQVPKGAIQLSHPAGEAGDSWWVECERFLTHVARVLSFASGVYLVPVMYQKVHRDELSWQLMRRSRSEAPFLPPFDELCLEQIFQRACESFSTHADKVEALDPAIRWLTASVPSWDQRLINAMTALECIIDRTAPSGTRTFLKSTAFKKIGKEVRNTLTSAGAPAEMMDKIPDLNRRSMKDQVISILIERKIATSDMPANWLEEIIKIRNRIIHTGVAPEIEGGGGVGFEQMVWAREVVIRLMLGQIEFSGSYLSWLHKNAFFRFPECELTANWARKQLSAQEGV